MNTMEENYKKLQEYFVSNHTGSSILENIAVIAPTPVIVFLSCFVTSFYRWTDKGKITTKQHAIALYILEYFIVILPLILCFTIISDFIYLFVVFLLMIVVLIMNVNLKSHSLSTVRKRISFSNIAQKPFITNFRSIIGILTALCILAVDFKIFPRRFAKTETFGFSLMDTGVGFFIVSNAVVVKQYKITSHSRLIYKNLISILPLVILGVLRLYSVEKIDYQKHVSEYGVHWNFFFTLAVVKFVSSCLLIAFPTKEFHLSVIIVTIHQGLLSVGLQNWILNNDDRSNFFLSNLEGITSLPGYISLYLGGVHLGTKVLSGTSKKKNFSEMSNIFKTIVGIFASTICLYYFFDVSRRLVNVTYVFWISFLSSLFIFLFMLVDLSLNVIFGLTNIKFNTCVPSILSAVNYNGLIFFLLANLMTGMVNISIQTIFVSDFTALIILSLYMLILCGIMTMLEHCKIKLKFW